MIKSLGSRECVNRLRLFRCCEQLSISTPRIATPGSIGQNRTGGCETPIFGPVYHRSGTRNGATAHASSEAPARPTPAPLSVPADTSPRNPGLRVSENFCRKFVIFRCHELCNRIKPDATQRAPLNSDEMPDTLHSSIAMRLADG